MWLNHPTARSVTTKFTTVGLGVREQDRLAHHVGQYFLGRTRLIQNGRKICSCRFVVQTEGHQSHRLDHLQTVFQAPAKQRGIACWHNDARTEEGRSACDQSLEVIIGPSHRMPKESYCDCVCGDAAIVLRYEGRALLNRIGQFTTALMSVDGLAQRIACLSFRFRSSPNPIPA